MSTMEFDRPFSSNEFSGDLLVKESRDEKSEYLSLAESEKVIPAV
jgi:hypothetical protein